MRLLAVPVAGAVCVALSACSFDGVQSLPLPGAEHGSDTYPVTAVFDDATNLVPNETCRMHDTVVGSVSSVTLGEDLKAHVVCRIKDSVKLPANARARLAETSLLGERYVALDPPTGTAAKGVLEPGSTLAEATNSVAPNVEVVLGALSHVLNGGSLGKAASISDELTTILQSTDVPATLEQLNTFVATMDQDKATIVATLESLARFAVAIAAQRAAIADAIDSVPEGLAVLEHERPKIVRTLESVQQLSDRAVRVIDASRAATVKDLEQVAPVVEQLAASGEDLALLVERLGSFPFPTNTMAILRGDYGGAMVNLVVDVDTIDGLLRPQEGSALKRETSSEAPPADPLSALPLEDLLGQPSGEPVTSALNDLLGGGTP
ncbi:MCE family protein [Nocardioides sp. NPDC127514]|uniref:MCE family protein n=1 Tax=unclassified Nocardioides TaxID=2615069 RepID=UPI003320072B